MKIAKADWKYVQVKPDVNFDPKKNKAVIDQVIKDSEALVRAKNRAFTEGVKERSQAASTFLKSMDMGGVSSDVLTYFGKNELSRLRGLEILRKLKAQSGLAVVKNNKLIRKPYQIDG